MTGGSMDRANTVEALETAAAKMGGKNFQRGSVLSNRAPSDGNPPLLQGSRQRRIAERVLGIFRGD